MTRGLPAYLAHRWTFCPLGRQSPENPSGEPNVDAASFKAFGAFAADKRSIYFDGKRTDDNSGDKQVDMSTLEETDIWNLLRDKIVFGIRGTGWAALTGFKSCGMIHPCNLL